jgi:glycosyltransferase involved in cell wall biosynthesis
MRVSVCTSVLNQTEYLKKMIESVRLQTFEDWELIIVDDGSTEDIGTVVQSFNDTRIRLHRFPENKGIPHGMNWALTHALGDYVQPLSADEWIEKDKFKIQVEFLDSHPEIGCVWGLPNKGPMGERPLWEQYAQKAHNRSKEVWVRTLLNLESIPIGGASMLMRKSVMDDIGVFDPDIFYCSDLEWFVRFFKKYDGLVLPFRWADADQPETRLTAIKPDSAEKFGLDIQKVRKKHQITPRPTEGKVTVGIPVFNMAQFVTKALDSVLNQTFKDVEILILDDASTDNLSEVLTPYAGQFKYLKFDENRGTVKAINQMASEATGEFYVSLAADDTLEPNFIEKALAEFKADSWLEFVASQTDFIKEDGSPFIEDHPFKIITRAVNKTREQWIHQMYYGNVYFGVGMYRTKVIKEVGGWGDHGVLTDYEMYLKLLMRENIKIIEQNLTHTRIHGENKSLLKPEEARKLKQRYHDAKVPYYQPRMKVILATPFYEMRGFSPYIQSLYYTCKYLTQLGIENEWWELSGDSYVDRAKNTITNKFLEDPDATDLFIIDSDMQWNPEAIIKILQLPELIVMGSYPQKNSWEKWTSIPMLREENGKMHPIGRVLEDGSALIQAEYISGGFIRMKRECLQKYKEHYKDHTYLDGSADPSYPERLYTEFYTCERADGLRWGEDRVFGKRMRAIGIEGYIYPNITFGHFGIKGWTGNYDHFLRNPKPPEAANVS